MSYQTTLQKRDKEVCRSDFENCPIIHVEKSDYEKVLPLWNLLVPYMPEQIAFLFEELKERDLRLMISDHGHYNLEFSVIPKSYTFPNYCKQIYNFPNRARSNNDFSFTSSQQRSRLGPRLMARFVELDIALGFQQTSFSASKKYGGYVWARMGFCLDEEKYNDKTISELSDRITMRLELLKDHIPSKIYEGAREAAQLNHPDDIYHLAAMDFDLTDYMNSEDFSPNIGVSRLKLQDIFDRNASLHPYESLSLAQKASEAISDLIEDMANREMPVTLGKLLLKGQSWDAFADYSDDRQLQRLTNYTGSFRCTQVVLVSHAIKPSAPTI